MTTNRQENPWLLTVRSASGSVVRRATCRTYAEAVGPDCFITMDELLAGCSCDVSSLGCVRHSTPPLNPKVLHLVGALHRAGVGTWSSGDGYTDDFVYVHLEDEWEGAAARAELPPGWVVTVTRLDEARRVLGLPVEFVAVDGGLGGDNDGDRAATCVSRRGGTVGREEAEAVSRAIAERRRRDPAARRTRRG